MRVETAPANIKGASALVSGGASGLGEATVRRLHEGGTAVTIADLNGEKGEALAAELGPRARFIETDVTDESAVARPGRGRRPGHPAAVTRPPAPPNSHAVPHRNACLCDGRLHCDAARPTHPREAE